MITVEQIVSKWTPSERERFKDLIEECRKRERTILENSEKAEENLERLAAGFNDLVSNIGELRKKSKQLLEISYETLLKLSEKEKIPSA